MSEDMKQTRRKRYQPDPEKDYRLTSVRFEEAENGVVVCCSYTLKDDVKAKVSKENEIGCGGYTSSYLDDQKHVFQDKAGAREFIDGELDKLWADGTGGSDGDGDEGEGE